MIKKHFLIIESLLQKPEGLTQNEINDMLQREGETPYARLHFLEAVKQIHLRTGLKLTAHNFGKNVWRYQIDRMALESYDGEQLLGSMIANMLQAEFLKEFRDLGNKIQPVVIPRGNEYLRPIGVALRKNLKLAVRYQKFDEPAYDCILHPYCLKIFEQRWYLFAFKEHSEHTDAVLQCFALDRILSLSVTHDTFRPNTSVDPIDYFRYAYGIWVDYKNYPVRDVLIACTPKVANFLRTLPLHHSQKEIEIEASLDKPQLTCHFTYHISVTPDFVGELQKWGNEIKIM